MKLLDTLPILVQEQAKNKSYLRSGGYHHLLDFLINLIKSVS